MFVNSGVRPLRHHGLRAVGRAELLAQIQSPIEQLTADGAYDGEPTYRTIAAHDDALAVVIPPRQDAVPSAGFETDPSSRDTHLLLISSLGRLRWQEITGYGQRALVETAIGRYKALIGERLRCPATRPGVPKPSSAPRFSIACSAPQGPTPCVVR